MSPFEQAPVDHPQSFGQNQETKATSGLEQQLALVYLRIFR